MGIEAQPVRETIVRYRLTADERARDHRFFTAMAAVCATLVFVGFAPTYYLRGLSGQAAAPPAGAPARRGIHRMDPAVPDPDLAGGGAAVEDPPPARHCRRGAGPGVVLVMGWLIAIDAARRGVAPPGAPPQPGFLLIPLGTVTSFAVLAAAGLWNRRRSETHKRFMLLATIALLTPALARYRFYGVGDGP